MNSAVDYPALLMAAGVAAFITAVIGVVARDELGKRAWLAAGVLALLLTVVGLIDLLRERPRETHIASIFLGVALSVLGALGTSRATRRVRHYFRWPIVFLVTFALLFGGLLLGATVLPRFIRA